MIVTGSLVAVEEKREGSSVAVAAASGTSVVVVDNGNHFRETGILQIADASYVYTMDEDEPLTLNLDDPLDADVEVGDPVLSLTDTARSESQVFAYVQLEEGQPAARAVVPSGLRTLALSDDLLTGGVVQLEPTSDGYLVVSLPYEEPAVVAGNIDSTGQSYVTTRLYGSTDTQAIADSTWTNLGVSGSWFIVPTLESADFTFDDVTSSAEILEPGWYLIDAQVRWAANTTGSRRIRIVSYGQTLVIPVTFADVELSRQTAAPQSGQIGQHLHQLVQLQSGDSIRVQCWQNSGGSLDVVGTPTSPGVLKLEFPTYWTIRRAV